jgi:hypothetical protein
MYDSDYEDGSSSEEEVSSVSSFEGKHYLDPALDLDTINQK